MSQVKQPKNLSTNSQRHPTLLQDVGTKKAVTQPRLEQHKREMKKKVEKEYPKPNSIFGLRGDQASFNAEVFGYSSLWDQPEAELENLGQNQTQTRVTCTQCPLWGHLRGLQFGAIQIFTPFFPSIPFPDNLISGRTVY